MTTALTATHDRRGLGVRDRAGTVLALTADETEAGLFIEEKDAWLQVHGFRRVGPWISHRPYGAPGSTPPTHIDCGVVPLVKARR